MRKAAAIAATVVLGMLLRSEVGQAAFCDLRSMLQELQARVMLRRLEKEESAVAQARSGGPPSIQRKQDVYAYPLEGPPYRTTWPQGAMEATVADVSGNRVRYYGPKERAQFALRFDPERRLILDHEGKPFDTRDGRSLRGTDGVAIFVMDRDGNFYASTRHEKGVFHHTSFLAGQPVAAAGEIRVVDGKLVGISDKSGHYTPVRYFTAQAIHRLKGLLGLGDEAFRKEVGLTLDAAQ